MEMISGLARVVHKNVDAPETLDSGGDETLARRLVSDIGGDGEGRTPLVLDESRGFLDRPGPTADENDRSSFPAEQKSHDAAQPLAGARDDRDLVLHSPHCALPPVV